MPRPSRQGRVRALALPRPQTAVTTEWIAAAIAVAVILGALLAS